MWRPSKRPSPVDDIDTAVRGLASGVPGGQMRTSPSHLNRLLRRGPERCGFFHPGALSICKCHAARARGGELPASGIRCTALSCSASWGGQVSHRDIRSSYGGTLTLLSATRWARENHADSSFPAFAAHIPFYPPCFLIERFVRSGRSIPQIPSDACSRYTGAPIKTEGEASL